MNEVKGMKVMTYLRMLAVYSVMILLEACGGGSSGSGGPDPSGSSKTVVGYAYSLEASGNTPGSLLYNAVYHYSG